MFMPRGGLESFAFEDQSTLRAASLHSIPEYSLHHGHHHVNCRVSGGGEMFRYGQVRFQSFSPNLRCSQNLSPSLRPVSPMQHRVHVRQVMM